MNTWGWVWIVYFRDACSGSARDPMACILGPGRHLPGVQKERGAACRRHRSRAPPVVEQVELDRRGRSIIERHVARHELEEPPTRRLLPHRGVAPARTVLHRTSAVRGLGRVAAPAEQAEEQDGHAPAVRPRRRRGRARGPARPTDEGHALSHEFALTDRVALVSGANRGLGLEMASALAEAGARAVYCVDLPKEPGPEWAKVQEYLAG
ncbi:uncharacterized protein B0H18DRAFT_492026 [Fomitopsis serialis]|uniref:uncharacterized protein n=1 Tax=Fomitopsis serialis TaxID=139415 RepID=UPI0020073F83|nr:uncharacterized protein B0H18DRAFT_492026 [Neoantrodia serialis]KAH9934901.1 hypothetical protein B0H18DRAFT_492026 [Neoantrodia serialis]